MKRSQNILREKLRKTWRPFKLAPLTVAVSSMVLAGCGDEAQPQVSAEVFKNLSECINQNPTLAAECQTAYQNALAEAAKTAPRYNSESDCVAEFGAGQCVQSPGTGWFMPMMAGYMFGKLMNSGRPSYSNVPVFIPKDQRNPNYGKWTTSTGYSYGNAGTSNRNVTLDNNALKENQPQRAPYRAAVLAPPWKPNPAGISVMIAPAAAPVAMVGHLRLPVKALTAAVAVAAGVADVPRSL
ncbi:DUF1190 domain-containing protein [Plesiomonas shigelloides subsp. oncorhynchi]|nr:DUF1190 domain-containing protein [Plesiomonas shigelloides]